MNFNKPPLNDSVVDIQIPPKVRQSADLPPDKVGLVESPMAHVWATYHSIFNDQLNQNLSDNGYIFPGVSTTTLTANVNKFGQSIVYNQSLNRMELNNGNRKNPTVAPPSYEPIQTYGSKTTTQIATEAVQQQNLGRIYVNSDTNELQFSVDGATIRTITSV